MRSRCDATSGARDRATSVRPLTFGLHRAAAPASASTHREDWRAARLDLCPSIDDPQPGAWDFAVEGFFTNDACDGTPLANIECAPILDEELGTGTTVNQVTCATDNGEKSFDFCIIDPATGAGTGNCFLEPAVCTVGGDPWTGAAYVVCAADDHGAWLSSIVLGVNLFHPEAICQALGYDTYGQFGGNCGSTCGYCDFDVVTSCETPGTRFFDGQGVRPPDEHGAALGGTVMWECVR